MGAGQRAQFRDPFTRAGDRHRRTARDPIDYLTTVVAQLSTVTSLMSVLYHT
jgi:hypothetical protein